jgi:hypothetical protein
MGSRLTGWSYERACRVKNRTTSSLDGLTLFITLYDCVVDGKRRCNFDFTQFSSSLILDLRISDASGNLLSFYVLHNNFATGVIQIMVKLSTPAPKILYIHAGNGVASSVSDFQATVTRPSQRSTHLSGFHWNNAPFSASEPSFVTGAPAMTIVGGVTPKVTSEANGFRRTTRRLVTDSITWTDYGGIQPNGTTGYAYTSGASWIDTAPASGEINYWSYNSNGSAGTVMSWASSATNYLRHTFDGTSHVFTKVVGGVTTSTHTVNIGVDLCHHFSIAWGVDGFQVAIDGVSKFWKASDTSVWAGGASVRLAFGATYVGGAASSFIGGCIIGFVEIHNRRLTALERGCLVYQIPPIPGIGFQERLTRYASNPTLAPTLPGEGDIVQEFSDFKIGEQFVRFYHAGLEGQDKLYRATSTDGLNWTGKTHVYGLGVGGEANGPLAVNVHGPFIIDSVSTLVLTYTLNFATGTLKYATSTDDGVTWTYQGDMLTRRIDGTWPSGFGNTKIRQVGTQFQMKIEGIHPTNGAWKIGWAYGTTLAGMIMNAEASPSSSLAFRTKSDLGSTLGTASGPFEIKIGDTEHVLLHGDPWTTLPTNIYLKSTVNRIDFIEHPGEMFYENNQQTLDNSDQVADPDLKYWNGGSQLDCEEFENAGAKARGVTARAEGRTISSLLTHDVEMLVGTSIVSGKHRKFK